jgi:release factor glutamine methyltransferase
MSINLIPTLSNTLKRAYQQLETHSDSAKFDAELLLAKVLNKDRSYLYTWPENILSTEQQQAFEELIQARIKGKAVAYLVGEQAFWTLNLQVTPDTLIPRPETELLIETALEYYSTQASLSILDLGTGSGAIALALASEFPHSQVLAVDISPAALKVAQHNAHTHQLDNVEFLHSSWFNQIPAQQFDLIISNPPYIEANDPHLQQGDLRYEPSIALASGFDGYDAIQEIIQNSPTYLKPQSYLMLEHGYQQAATTRHYLSQANFEDIQSRQDLAKHERITIGRLPTN